ncbi:endonuclease/exonuclease/phosphatase family protein [Massilia sp.]|uniref:endonuclease/exonuclease/phosphatase family protein n=1 Tax=Massilia sp. TaxID=1882437 RepID=UPI0028990319|nr:endonuclease/exonuclease/phosphatase family protein [Massilia sp.]
MFTLITWNIQSGRSPDGKPDLGRVVGCLDRFARHDVVCLQEVASGFDPGGEDQFAALRARMPGHAAAAAVACDLATDPAEPGAADGPRRRIGSMILSRHPVLQVLRHSLPWPPDPAVPSMPRTALEVTLATPGGLLRIVNAHLEYFSYQQRLAQVERLRELQRDGRAQAMRPRAAGSGPFAPVPRAAPALLAGDFNMLPGSPEHQRLLAPFGDDTPPWRDCWQVVQPGRRHAPTVGLHDLRPDAPPPFTFDYVFASADLTARVRRMRVDASEQGSDHQAVLVELDWPAG